MYPHYLTKYNVLINNVSPVEIEMTLGMGDEGDFILETEIEVTEDIETTNNKIIVMITNRYSNDYFATVANYAEENFDLLSIGDTETYSTSIDLNPSFSLEDVSVAVLVQTLDGNTAVLGARYYPITELMDPVVQSEIQFGEVAVGTTETLPVTIVNYWDTPLTGMFIAQGEFEIQPTFEVPAFQSMDFDLNFTPSAVQDFYVALIIMTDNADYPNDIINVYGTGIGTDADNTEIAPVASLLGNYPNPFNPSTTISYSLGSTVNENVKLKIFDIKGKVIKTFDNLTMGENQSVEWNGKDENGKSCASGIYFYQISNVRNPISKKMILMK